eukprot:TRINITY_DN75208_c0_g1_i1.p1 TRINITY_DN75208_c0_g1~~TRINITY_DN75208_c0_g1_i1.p1  ORF type:complete len:398 (+),score=53.01 TRINITY_DN75208_c0_g1_i1:58-1251(+)
MPLSFVTVVLLAIDHLAVDAFQGEDGTNGRDKPAVLLYEYSRDYLEALVLGPAGSNVDVVSCEVLSHCEQPSPSLRERIAAVVGQPRNLSTLSELPNLKLVQSTSYMYPRLKDIPQKVTVASYMPDWRDTYGVEPIAEFVLASVFQWNYQLSQKSANFAACAFRRDAPLHCQPDSRLTAHPTLMGMTLGVLGYGKIGQAVARRAAALGMRVVATKLHGPFEPTPAPLAWLSPDNDKLFMESDFVIVTVPGSVKHLVSYRELELMKPTAVLVPVSANPIDYHALYEGLLYKNIGGAVLDTWPQGCWHFPETRCGPPFGPDVQPSANSNFTELDNVLLLPGLAMRDNKFWVNSAAWVGDNLINLVTGRPLRGIVRNGTAAYTSEALRGDTGESAGQIAV